MRSHGIDRCMMSSQTGWRQGTDDEYVWVMSSRTVKLCVGEYVPCTCAALKHERKT